MLSAVTVLKIMYSRHNFKKLQKMLAEFLYKSHQVHVSQKNLELDGQHSFRYMFSAITCVLYS